MYRFTMAEPAAKVEIFGKWANINHVKGGNTLNLTTKKSSNP